VRRDTSRLLRAVALLGLQWIVRVFPPHRFPRPLGRRARAFNTLHGHRTPTDAQVRALLDFAGVPR
jgi:hypothetical protein